MKMTATVAVTAMMLGSPAASAKDVAVPNPLVAALEKCLSITDDRQRLACTDIAARKLVDAEKARDLVVIDRDQVKKTRRSLFGLSLGTEDVFANRDAPVDRITTLDTTLVGARLEANDRWLLTLAEGGRWRTTEAWVTGSTPKPGSAVSVRAGALGSYIMRVAGQRTVRVMRVN